MHFFAAAIDRGTQDLVMGVPYPPEQQNGNLTSTPPPTDHHERATTDNGEDVHQELQSMRYYMNQPYQIRIFPHMQCLQWFIDIIDLGSKISPVTFFGVM